MLKVECHTRALFFILHSLFFILHSGCAPVATVHVIPLNLQKINVNRPLLATFTADECYYWVNDESELCIAMTGKIKAGLFSTRFFGIVGRPGRHEFDLSLVLEGLPAGSSRAYLATFRTARSRMRDGGAHTRFASFEGVVSVWDYGGQKMGGRFRLKAVQQSFMVLSGWWRDTQVLCLGEFTAEHDRRRGEALFARTEEGALKRPPSRRYGIPIEGRRPEPESTDATQ